MREGGDEGGRGRRGGGWREGGREGRKEGEGEGGRERGGEERGGGDEGGRGEREGRKEGEGRERGERERERNKRFINSLTCFKSLETHSATRQVAHSTEMVLALTMCRATLSCLSSVGWLAHLK